jgi:hypothetical protein
MSSSRFVVALAFFLLMNNAEGTPALELEQFQRDPMAFIDGLFARGVEAQAADILEVKMTRRSRSRSRSFQSEAIPTDQAWRAARKAAERFNHVYAQGVEAEFNSSGESTNSTTKRKGQGFRSCSVQPEARPTDEARREALRASGAVSAVAILSSALSASSSAVVSQGSKVSEMIPRAEVQVASTSVIRSVRHEEKTTAVVIGVKPVFEFVASSLTPIHPASAPVASLNLESWDVPDWY